MASSSGRGLLGITSVVLVLGLDAGAMAQDSGREVGAATTRAETSGRPAASAAAPSAATQGPAADDAPAGDERAAPEAGCGYQPTLGLVIAGSLLFLPPYIAGFVGAATDTTYNRGWLFVPIIGHATFAATTDTYIGPLFTGLLWAGTFVQALGVALLTAGFALNDAPTPARLVGPVVHVAPIVDGSFAGLALLGRY